MFLDTSGLLSVYEPKDQFHSLAVDHLLRAEQRVTTNYVLVELASLMIARRVRQDRMIRFLHRTQEDSRVEIVWVTRELHEAGMELLSRRLDKTYSLCDAVSFAVMREREITEALTSDRHFEQEGFTRLLK
jgi:uncharacterized protein